MVLLGGDNHAIPGSFHVYPLSAGLQAFFTSLYVSTLFSSCFLLQDSQISSENRWKEKDHK